MSDRILALVPDLFFRSKLESLRRMGWEVDYANPAGARLAIVDLDAPQSGEAIGKLSVPILGYTSHEMVPEWQARLGGRGMAVSRNEFSRRLVELVEQVARGETAARGAGGKDPRC
ncbi:MAG: hypothetical protein HY558_05800 [Euryarchaeota archaeon]|nr:hypothetical protein [Euryarchaeota archaeon]